MRRRPSGMWEASRTTGAAARVIRSVRRLAVMLAQRPPRMELRAMEHMHQVIHMAPLIILIRIIGARGSPYLSVRVLDITVASATVVSAAEWI
jgi:hypothetical protein